MAKIKVYELAKELDKQSKEILTFLQEKNIEVKAAQSSVDEDVADMVRKQFGAKAENTPASASQKAEKPAPPKPEQPRKKKNIIFVSNPQHSKMPAGQRSPMNANRNPRPRQGQEGAPKTPAPKPIQLGPNQMINKSTGKVMEMLPPRKPEPVPEAASVQEERNAQRLNREGNAGRQQGNRPGDKPVNKGGHNEERRTGERFANRQGGQGRPNQSGNDRQNNPAGKGSYQGNGSGQAAGRGFGGGDRPQGRNAGQDNRFPGKKENKSFASDAPMMQNDKHRDDQRRINQSKDKRSKKDTLYEDKEQEIKNRNKAGRFIKPEPKPVEQGEQIKVITLPQTLTIKELAEKMKLQPAVIIKKLFLQGKIVTVNQEIAFEDAENIAIEFDIMCEQEVKVDVIEELLKEEEDAEDTLAARAPVICVMGHVDHGKTSLLDAIRKTNVTDREAGGITQHIGAYSVNASGRKITFLDTPGHEAFTAMRMRGANATDIAILVVAADDGVMPQTVEAINHAKAAGIEIIVAVNKIDKPGANIDRVKQELSEYELIPEDWGGSTVFAPVSAKAGTGIQELLEMILLTADILELKANPKRKARGLVIEAQLDKGRGPVATVLVQKGTLKVGDFISAGASHGKVRAMIDDKGRRVKEAGPSTPVEIMGLGEVPSAGDTFAVVENEKLARELVEKRKFDAKEEQFKLYQKVTLDNLFSQIEEGEMKTLPLIVKADVQGSVEAVRQSLEKLSNEEVRVRVIHGAVGAISESDVMLASASNAIIIGFNVRPHPAAAENAKRDGVDVRLYRIIYDAIEEVQTAIKGMLAPKYREVDLARVEVRQVYKITNVGIVAGCYVLSGKVERKCSIRIVRDGIIVGDDKIDGLRRFKDDVKEVAEGYECGISLEKFTDIKEGDIFEAYMIEEYRD